ATAAVKRPFSRASLAEACCERAVRYTDCWIVRRSAALARSAAFWASSVSLAAAWTISCRRLRSEVLLEFFWDAAATGFAACVRFLALIIDLAFARILETSTESSGGGGAWDGGTVSGVAGTVEVITRMLDVEVIVRGGGAGRNHHTPMETAPASRPTTAAPVN